jgi:hypothetical protein
MSAPPAQETLPEGHAATKDSGSTLPDSGATLPQGGFRLPRGYSLPKPGAPSAVDRTLFRGYFKHTKKHLLHSIRGDDSDYDSDNHEAPDGADTSTRPSTPTMKAKLFDDASKAAGYEHLRKTPEPEWSFPVQTGQPVPPLGKPLAKKPTKPLTEEPANKSPRKTRAKASATASKSAK